MDLVGIPLVITAFVGALGLFLRAGLKGKEATPYSKAYYSLACVLLAVGIWGVWWLNRLELSP